MAAPPVATAGVRKLGGLVLDVGEPALPGRPTGAGSVRQLPVALQRSAVATPSAAAALQAQAGGRVWLPAVKSLAHHAPCIFPLRLSIENTQDCVQMTSPLGARRVLLRSVPLHDRLEGPQAFELPWVRGPFSV